MLVSVGIVGVPCALAHEDEGPDGDGAVAREGYEVVSDDYHNHELENFAQQREPPGLLAYEPPGGENGECHEHEATQPELHLLEPRERLHYGHLYCLALLPEQGVHAAYLKVLLLHRGVHHFQTVGEDGELLSVCRAGGLADVVDDDAFADGISGGIDHDAPRGVALLTDALELVQYLLTDGGVLLHDLPDREQRVHALQHLA